MIEGLNVRVLKQPHWVDIEGGLDAMFAQGARGVAFNRINKCYVVGAQVANPPADYPHGWLVYPDIEQSPTHAFGDTMGVDRLHAAALWARRAGFEEIVIKPMVDSDQASWRGYIVLPRALRTRWLADYKTRLLEPLFPILKDPLLRDMAVLCFGTEFFQITRDWGADIWINVARWLRSRGVRCRMTYAANWGWWNPGDQSEFRRLEALWRSSYVDMIGVDIYVPLVGERRGAATYEELVSGQGNIGFRRVAENQDGSPMTWMVPFSDDLLALRAEVGKPLYITEIGYGRAPYAQHDPARDPQGEWTPDYSAALPAVRYARQFWREAGADAIYWWEGATPGFGVDGTHNVVGNELGVAAFG